MCELILGSFLIRGVVPNKEGESSKVKVRVRLDIHGVFTVVSASLVESEIVEFKGQEDKAKETTVHGTGEVC